MRLVFLGTSQDAGLPQLGCKCTNCQKAHRDKSFRRFSASIAIVDDSKGISHLIDASPDIKYQYQLLQKIVEKLKLHSSISYPESIFLTHAHFGHISGLWSLGKECLNSKGITVFCTEKMVNFLINNHPFTHLISDGNIKLQKFPIGQERLFDGFQISSFEVPHRNEYADTVGYIISNKKNILYLPDIDCWNAEVIDLIRKMDVAIIDGTFYSKDEIPLQRNVPHPLINESVELLNNLNTKVIFTHLNHSNPLIDPENNESKEIVAKGFNIAYDGMVIEF